MRTQCCRPTRGQPQCTDCPSTVPLYTERPWIAPPLCAICGNDIYGNQARVELPFYKALVPAHAACASGVSVIQPKEKT